MPKTCVFCSELGYYVCEKCEKEKITFILEQKCHVCRKNIKTDLVHEECKLYTNLDGVFVVCEYNKNVEKIIAEIKYNLYYKTADYVVEKMFKFLDKIYIPNLVLVPIPIHRQKKWQRGFNQTEIISNNLAKLLDIKSINLVKRVKNTQTQVGMNRDERIKNLKDVFKLQPNKFLQKNNFTNILLIDDVMTSGTTLEECAKVLKKNNYKKVYGFVFARGN